MPTLILPPRYTPDSIALSKAAGLAGWRVKRLANWRPPQLADDEIILYGEPLFAAVVADQLDIALLEPPFNWLANVPDKFRGRDVRFTTLGEARRIDRPAFIKPADDKCFPAKVYSSGAQLPESDLLDAATPTLRADPVTWLAEFRCFVLDGQVETISPYLRCGELAQNDQRECIAANDELHEAITFAGRVLAEVALPPAVVLDVGLIVNHGWAVVEANAAWGSGICDCDPGRVLEVVRRGCRPKGALEPSDLRWVVRR